MSAALAYALPPHPTGWEQPSAPAPANDNCHLHLAYDAVGQMTSYQKGLAAGSICAAPSGIDMVSLGYDVLGRPTTTDFADINTPDMTRSYDANGNLKTVRRGAGADLIRWTYYYNEINLLNYEYLDVDGRNYDAYYGFNTAGHRVFRILPSNRYLDETRDGLGRLTSVAGSGGGTSYASNISYHPSGAIAGATYGNGQVFSQTLNARLQPSHLLSQLGGNTALDLTYTYDVRGKVTNILNGAITGDNRTYAYDGIGRLTSSSGPWGSGAYSYDALGNIRTKTEGGRALVMSYDAKNRLVSHTDTGGPNRTLNYDNRGNVTQLGGLFFTYDRSDQPINISGTASGTYCYDGNKRRVKSVVDGKTIYNVYDASGTLVHIDKVTDGKKIDYIGKFVRIENNVPTYLHMDHLGSAQTGTSANGTVAWREQYMPFGETMTNPLGNADLAGYTGHIKDSATGLNYMQARYYDPLIGRFLSVDPVGFSPDAPYMFNRYTYVNNDPLNLIDPDGQLPVFVIPLAIFIAKEIAAEGASRATGGATDILSTRRTARNIFKAGGKQLAKRKAKKEAATNRAKSIEKGVPETKLGHSGKPKQHTVKHSSRKSANQAAKKEADGAGGKVRNDASPANSKQGPHFQAEDAAGKNVKPVVHHERPQK